MKQSKKKRTAFQLPQSICFRVTRRCNASCTFCLAPPVEEKKDTTALLSRLAWLLENGVRTIHFCGGEPTLYPELDSLLLFVHEQGGKSKLTTNGIVMRQPLLDVIKKTKTEVKVSLHGDEKHHNALVGREAFHKTVETLQAVRSKNIKVSVQSTLINGKTEMLHWLTAFCIDTGIKRLTILPFIPRGKGGESRADHEFSIPEREALKKLVKETRKKVHGHLDLRWIDFNSKPYHVVEPDGHIVLEGLNESQDVVLGSIS